MKHMDLQVVETALRWAQAGETVWLCTVLATYGSSPREPGSMLAAKADSAHVGSLSGGCVEEDFIARLCHGIFSAPTSIISYGGDTPDTPKSRCLAVAN